jgi:hypothetical protein
MREGVTREEHLAWCKSRALEYLPADPREAFASMGSDLNKHEETKDHSAIKLGFMLLLGGHLDSAEKMREFINGFH